MAERPPHSLSDHPLARAFRLLFDEPKVGAPTILDRVELAKSFARALFTSQSSGEGTAGTPAEWRSRAEEARSAYSLLDSVLAGRRKVFIDRWHSDLTGSKEARDGLRSERRDKPVEVKKSEPAKPAPAPKAPEPPKPAPAEAAPSPQSAQPAPPPLKRDRTAAAENALLGRFLHNRGLITLSQLIAAVVWQRRSRPSVGELAVERRYLSLTDVLEVLRRRGPGEYFCDAAVRCGFLTQGQADELLDEQRKLQRRIGDYFVEHGILSRQVVDRLAEEARAFQESTSTSG
ncbi:hypothetical protein L6R52_14055 [Myxococcota bacterium]|nr:hypothetical protein [Myxococcota bacterium]